MKKERKTKIKNTIFFQHILNNKKEYIIISLIFVCSIFLGVFFINNINETQKNEITTYFTSSINELKQTQNLQMMSVLKNNIIRNITLAISLWFLGTTIIGIPIVLAIIAYRGFCLGYTISISILTFGSVKGISFVFSALVLHNIIFIPAIIAIGVSGLKLYKSTVKDKRKQNIKLEILRHTFFSLTMLIILVIAGIIETFVTTNIILAILKYL